MKTIHVLCIKDDSPSIAISHLKFKSLFLIFLNIHKIHIFKYKYFYIDFNNI